jgi:putative transposase
MISKGHSKLSIAKQCKILKVNRSSFYYKPIEESVLNLKLMSLMDAHHLKYPEKGGRRMWVWLTKDMGFHVSENRIERLYYRVMGLRSLLPGPHTSKRCPGHKVYPYLLRDLLIVHPNQVWATDITFIPMKKGFMYLMAVVDLYSRKIMHWSISNNMDADWCTQVIKEAVEMHGCPCIINTDQGSQFTSETFSGYVLGKGIKLSMDGKGRATDNAFIERFWRDIKYEKIYLNPPESGLALYQLIKEYIPYYNTTVTAAAFKVIVQ